MVNHLFGGVVIRKVLGLLVLLSLTNVLQAQVQPDSFEESLDAMADDVADAAALPVPIGTFNTVDAMAVTEFNQLTIIKSGSTYKYYSMIKTGTKATYYRSGNATFSTVGVDKHLTLGPCSPACTPATTVTREYKYISSGNTLKIARIGTGVMHAFTVDPKKAAAAFCTTHTDCNTQNLAPGFNQALRCLDNTNVALNRCVRLDDCDGDLSTPDFPVNTVSAATPNGVCSGRGYKAAILVDKGLTDQTYQSQTLYSMFNQYRTAAAARRGFSITMRVVPGIDKLPYQNVKAYINAMVARYPGLEGVLLAGNIPVPTFYKNSDHGFGTPTVRPLPRYYQDTNGVFEKRIADGAIDLNTDRTNWVAQIHDFDYTAKAATPNALDPELWISWMPVGFEDLSKNTYPNFATQQLGPYLTKVLRYYRGQLTSNGRFYKVGNDTVNFEKLWDAYSPANIELYGKVPTPVPAGMDPSATDLQACGTGDPAKCLCVDKYGMGANKCCFASLQLGVGPNLCYTAWPLLSYANHASFDADYTAAPWVGDAVTGLNLAETYIEHMQTGYQVVSVVAHSSATFSLVTTDEVQNAAATGNFKVGLILSQEGCSAGGFWQPSACASHPGLPVSCGYYDRAAAGSGNPIPNPAVENNVSMSYMYGNTNVLAITTSPFQTNKNYSNANWAKLKTDPAFPYLGLVYRDMMRTVYTLYGNDPTMLRQQATEMLLGDPFVDLKQ